MKTVSEHNGFRVGDLVRMCGSPVVYRVEQIQVTDATPEGWASFLPVRRDGERDRRRTPFSGALRNVEKANQ